MSATLGAKSSIIIDGSSPVAYCKSRLLQELQIMAQNGKYKIPTVRGKELLILEMLTCRDRWFGLEMVEASSGALKRGTIYVTLQRMEEKGLIKSATEERTFPEIGIPRRFYSITGYGVRVLEATSIAENRFSKLSPCIALAGGAV